MTETLQQVLAAYNEWLGRQPLAVKTRVAYRFQGAGIVQNLLCAAFNLPRIVWPLMEQLQTDF